MRFARLGHEFPTRTVLGLCVAAAAILCVAGATPRPVPAGEWRVVVTRPRVTTGWKPGEEFRDNERLTNAFRQLAAEGYDPVFVQQIEEKRLDGNGEYRLVIASRAR